MAAAAKTRRNSAIVCGVCYFLTIPFLILVLIGNTSIKPVLTDIYFFRLDVSDIIPLSSNNAQLLNSIARSLGLHDFYQVGLWNFCEGYKDEGVTFCSPTKRFWWFNPIEILTNELLAGATIALPSQVNTILTILRIGQQVMFGFFLSGIVINFVLMLATPLVLRTRWWSLPVVALACISGILITVAAAIATIMSVAARYALTQQSELNIRADIGVRMFVFMWIAAAFTDLAFLVHAGLGCCCAPYRTAKTSEAKSRTSSEKTKPRIPLPSFVRRRRNPRSQSISPSGTAE